MILTSKHLAVIRAALEYWDDEMSPHDPSLYTAYFDEPIGNGKWINEIVAELRTGLPMCQLHMFCVRPKAQPWWAINSLNPMTKPKGPFPKVRL